MVYGKVLCGSASQNQAAAARVTFPISFKQFFSTGLSHAFSGSGCGHCIEAFSESDINGFTIYQYQPWNFTKDPIYVCYINIGY